MAQQDGRGLRMRKAPRDTGRAIVGVPVVLDPVHLGGARTLPRHRLDESCY